MNKAGFWHGGSSETVEFVDDAYTTVNKSWLFATSRSAVTLYLQCGIIVQLVSTVDKILTDIVCRAVQLQ